MFRDRTSKKCADLNPLADAVGVKTHSRTSLVFRFSPDWESIANLMVQERSTEWCGSAFSVGGCSDPAPDARVPERSVRVH